MPSPDRAGLDLNWIRPQFPSLALVENGHPAAYFDGPGGTQVPQQVIDAIADYLTRSNSNTHGLFPTSRRSDETVLAAHQAAADLLNCDFREIVFGANMTSLTFAVSRAIARDLSPGDEIVLTYLDHDANFSPWKALEEKGVVIRVADFRPDDCTLDTDALLSLINEKTKLVAVGYASNAVGSINQVQRIARAARDAGALSFIDAVHYAPHGPIDVQEIGCDFLACSAYKFFGPHQGILYGKREHLERLKPYKVRPAEEALPGRWETGTQNHEAMAGVTAAIDYLAEFGRHHGVTKSSRRETLNAAMSLIQQAERALFERLATGLLAVPGLTFYGIRDPQQFDRRAPTAAVRVEGHTPQQIAQRLGEQGLFVWDGNFYALNFHERLDLEPSGGTVRIGLAHYNTPEEVDRLLTALNNLD